MEGRVPEYKSFVITRRLKMPGIVETMSEQLPEVQEAFRELEGQLLKRMISYGVEGWRIISHSHSVYNNILIVSVLLSR